MQYYFVSYVMGNPHQVGRVYVGVDGVFCAREVESEIAKTESGRRSILITNYHEISKEEYEANQ